MKIYRLIIICTLLTCGLTIYAEDLVIPKMNELNKQEIKFIDRQCSNNSQSSGSFKNCAEGHYRIYILMDLIPKYLENIEISKRLKIKKGCRKYYKNYDLIKYVSCINEFNDDKINISKNKFDPKKFSSTNKHSIEPLSNWHKPKMPRKVSIKKLTVNKLYNNNEIYVYMILVGNNLNDIINKKIMQGTGVAISSKYLLTNCHLFNKGRYVKLYKNNRYYNANINFGNIISDKCIIKSDIELKYVKGIRKFNELKIGEKIYAIGSPKGFENTISEGIISGLRKNNKANIIQITAPISKGSSGGGLFDEYGNLIGITSATIIGAQNINLAISADEYWRW